MALHSRLVEHPRGVFCPIRGGRKRNVDGPQGGGHLGVLRPVAASTALIKQHYVFDGISGIALAFGLWYGWIRPALN